VWRGGVFWARARGGKFKIEDGDEGELYEIEM